MIGVRAGEGEGVGISLMGDKHLLGTSSRMLGGCSKLLPPK